VPVEAEEHHIKTKLGSLINPCANSYSYILAKQELGITVLSANSIWKQFPSYLKLSKGQDYKCLCLLCLEGLVRADLGHTL